MPALAWCEQGNASSSGGGSCSTGAGFSLDDDAHADTRRRQTTDHRLMYGAELSILQGKTQSGYHFRLSNGLLWKYDDPDSGGIDVCGSPAGLGPVGLQVQGRQARHGVPVDPLPRWPRTEALEHRHVQRTFHQYPAAGVRR